MTVNSQKKRNTKAVNALERLVDAQHVDDLSQGLVDLRNALLKSVIFGSNKNHQTVGNLLSEILQREIWVLCTETVDYSQIVAVLELLSERNAPDSFNREMPQFLGNIIIELSECDYAACTIIKHLEILEGDIKCDCREESATIHLPRTRASEEAERVFDIGRNHTFTLNDLAAEIDRINSITKPWILCDNINRDEILKMGGQTH